MDKFIRNLEDLPKAWQEEINEGLQKYIVTQAKYIMEDLPSGFLAYIDGEIAKAKASMQKMVEASGYKYAVFGGISHIYVWNKERLKVLEKMKEDFLNAQEATSEPEQDFNSDRLKRLHCCCQKAIKKGYLVKTDGGYRKTEKWTKSLLAYFLTNFLKEDGAFPDKEYSEMFGESRLSKASGQLVNNKTGDGKPRGYEMVDELIKNDSKQL